MRVTPKRRLWLIIVPLVFVLIIGLFFYLNSHIVKVAVHREELIGKDYIICQQVRTTGFDWMIYESSDVSAPYSALQGRLPLFVKLEGNIPLEEYRNYYPRVRFNNFICFGEIIGEGVDADNLDKYIIFRVDRWEVLYPVIRNSSLPDFLLPKHGFNFFDTLD